MKLELSPEQIKYLYNTLSNDFNAKMNLILVLLGCPSVQDNDTRNRIVQDLPEEIRSKIRHHPTPLIHVSNIVSLLLAYSEGLITFLNIVHAYEGNSIPWNNVKKLILSLSNGPPPPPGISPYKGMITYDRNDAHLFFGREGLTDELVEYLKNHTFLAIVGASGSGKSSLARAGLIPKLLNDETEEENDEWVIYETKPTASPFEELAHTLHSGEKNSSVIRNFETQMMKDPAILRTRLRTILHESNKKRLLLFVDQFEELFTNYSEASDKALERARRRSYILNLLYAAGITSESENPNPKVHPITIVLTLRADYYEKCAEVAELRMALERHQKYIGVMSKEETTSAIKGPIKKQWDIHPSLVERMLRDVGYVGDQEPEPGSLPLLSHALHETWKKRSGYAMTLEGYESIGGVQGAIAQTAETTYQKLDDGKKEIARKLFISLVELGDESGTSHTRRSTEWGELLPPDNNESDVTRAILTLLKNGVSFLNKMLAKRISSLPVETGVADATRAILTLLKNGVSFLNEMLAKRISSLPVETGVADVLEKLIEKRLVTTDKDKVEVAHEALIREWDKIGKWVKESRYDLDNSRLLKRRASEWQEAGKPIRELLTAKELTPIREWLKKSTYELPKLEREYLAASQRVNLLSRLWNRATVSLLSMLVLIGSLTFWINYQQGRSPWENINLDDFKAVTAISDMVVGESINGWVCVGTASEGVYCRGNETPQWDPMANLTLPSLVVTGSDNNGDAKDTPTNEYVENTLTSDPLDRINKLVPNPNLTDIFLYGTTERKGLWALVETTHPFKIGEWVPIYQGMTYTHTVDLAVSEDVLFAVSKEGLLEPDSIGEALGRQWCRSMYKSKWFGASCDYPERELNSVLSRCPVGQELEANCWQTVILPADVKTIQGIEVKDDQLYLIADDNLWQESLEGETARRNLFTQDSDLKVNSVALQGHEICPVVIYDDCPIAIIDPDLFYLAAHSSDGAHVLMEVTIGDDGGVRKVTFSEELDSRIASIVINPISGHRVKAFILLDSGEVYEVLDVNTLNSLGHWPNSPTRGNVYDLKAFPCHSSDEDPWLLMGHFEGIFEYREDGYCSTKLADSSKAEN